MKQKETPNEFFIEIGVEEMPSDVISPALNNLLENGEKRFASSALSHAPFLGYATPRRLILYTPQLAARQADRTETVIGPPKKVAFDLHGNPTPAAIGFAQSTGVSLAQLTVSKTAKGEYLSAKKIIPSQPTATLLQEIVPDLIASLHFKKEMRWKSAASFVRPIRWIVASYNRQQIPCAFAGVSSGDISYGHRLIAPQPFRVTDFASFQKGLRKRFVWIDPVERYQQIKTEIVALAKKVGGTVNAEEGLLGQAVFATEYPVALLGTFDRSFLAIPQEIIRTVMKEHQGYFPMDDAQNPSQLLPHFIAISNNDDPQGVIRSGNERVLRARLADAQFFVSEDRKATLHDRLPALKGIAFREGLGTLYDKTERLIALSQWIAFRLSSVAQKETESALKTQNSKLKTKNLPSVSHEDVESAARYCKCDLTTGIVREFPSLQGVMGRILSPDPKIGKGIAQHYQPRYPGDALPETPVGQILAVADKLDSIVGYFGIGAIPTGSEDPYALRRQGTGIIQILSEIPLFQSFALRDAIAHALSGYRNILGITFSSESVMDAVSLFLNQRLGAHLQSYKIRYDLITAVLEKETPFSPYETLRLARALHDFSTQPLFNPLLVCYKRATRILPHPVSGNIDTSLLTLGADYALYEALLSAEGKMMAHENRQEFNRDLEALATLHDPLDRFFTEVLVMAPDERIRNNNFLLLQRVKHLFAQLGNFSKIQESYEPQNDEPGGCKDPRRGVSDE